MDTSAEINQELRNATVKRKQQPGHRCLDKQRDGNYALSVGIATGCFTSDQLHKLADIIDNYGQIGHFSTAQSMIIVGIPEVKFYEAKQAVLQAGFDLRSIGRDVRQVKCCPGADFSPFGLQRTLPMAKQLESLFRGFPTPMKFKISVSGCPNCCANTMLNDFGIHGMPDGWKIVIGGKMGTVPAIAQELAVSVPSDDVPKYLAAVLRAYKEKAKPDERLAKTIERIGFADFKEAVETKLEHSYDDLIEKAKEIRETEMLSECVNSLHK
jgi:dissimilatory sulfite reductase (desulfoviridin) alpha/beta subunit